MIGAIGSHVPSMSVPAYVKRLWIVNGNGFPQVIDSEEELKFFRSSFGIFGAIYKIQIQVFPQQFFIIEKIGTTAPYNNPIYPTHVTQLVLHTRNIGVINDEMEQRVETTGKKNYEYIDIVLKPIDALSEKEQVENLLWMKAQNVAKNSVFIFDGIYSLFSKSTFTGFFDIFVPKNNSRTNSNGIVKAFPLLPKIALQLVPLPLEAGIYVTLQNLVEVSKIILKHYELWYTINDFDCINLVIRKVLTNNNCLIDMTFKRENVDVVVLIDCGFYASREHQYLLNALILELLEKNLVYGFHLGKFTNENIILFAKNLFSKHFSRLNEMKKKFDPAHIFSTPFLDFMFSI
jgi:hypothetical protein